MEHTVRTKIGLYNRLGLPRQQLALQVGTTIRYAHKNLSQIDTPLDGPRKGGPQWKMPLARTSLRRLSPVTRLGASHVGKLGSKMIDPTSQLKSGGE